MVEAIASRFYLQKIRHRICFVFVPIASNISAWPHGLSPRPSPGGRYYPSFSGLVQLGLQQCIVLEPQRNKFTTEQGKGLQFYSVLEE